MSRTVFRKILIGLTRNVAFTTPAAEDPRLRGRTYAIPFEDVWRTSMALLDGGIPGWELLEHDDREGIIRGVAHGRVERFASAITIRITLDVDAQTRVDALAASRVGRYDLGINARRLDAFYRRLDDGLGRTRPAPLRPEVDRSTG